MTLDKVIAVRTNKTVYLDGDGRAVKVFGEGFQKSDVLNEALNHARAEETALNVPKLLEVCTVDGKWAIVTEYIKGETLDVLMKEHPEKHGEYMDLFVTLQVEMQKQNAPLMTHLSDKMERKIARSPLDATTRYDLHMRLAALPRHNKLCHGDFNPSNIIIRESDGKPFILDWSHATQGNASADAARTYLLFRLAGETQTAEEYLKLFCRKTDTAWQYVEKWIPIVAASESVKQKPEERDMLLRFVDVVDYE